MFEYDLDYTKKQVVIEFDIHVKSYECRDAVVVVVVIVHVPTGYKKVVLSYLR